MKNMSRRKKNNIIIASLCAIVVLMGIGYAAFSSQLRINGTSSISSNWDIRITNIETVLPSESGGDGIPDGYNITEPTYTPTSATFNAGFELPGSVIGYIVEVSNLGTIDGQVTIGNLSCGDNSVIDCGAEAYDANPMEGLSTNGFYFENGFNDYSDIEFKLKPNEKHYIMIMVGYADVTEQPTDLDAEIKLDLVYQQAGDDAIDFMPSGEKVLVGNQEVDIMYAGDGLYKDEYESGKYIYRGTNPNNYIEFGGDLWRIISINNDGTIKIMKNESIGKIAWNNYFAYDWNTASLNTYLNGAYLLQLLDSDKIISHTWNIGDRFDESSEKWTGKVGLISVSEYLNVNTNIEECNNYSLYNNNVENCVLTNWIYKIIESLNDSIWTITVDGMFPVEILSNGEFINLNGSYESKDVFPALYLKSGLKLEGNGSETDPFRIIE